MDQGRRGGPVKRGLDRRSPPRNDRGRPSFNRDSPPRKRRREDGDRFGDDRNRRGGRDFIRLLDHPFMGFNQFLDTQRDRPSIAQAQRRYEDYKFDYNKANARSFFKTHKNESEYVQKYHPTSIIEQRQKEAEEAKLRAEQFQEQILSPDFVWPNYDHNPDQEQTPPTTKQQEDGAEPLEEGETDSTPSHKSQFPDLVSTLGRIKRDCENIHQIASEFDNLKGIKSNLLLGRLPAPENEGDPVPLQFTEFQNLFEKAPSKALQQDQELPRRPPTTDKSFSEDEYYWVTHFDRKVQSILNVDPTFATGERQINEDTADFLRDKIFEENPQMHKCQLCQKKFLSNTFAQNHIRNKHSDELANVKAQAIEEQFFRNYMNDPDRVKPSTQYEKAEHLNPPPPRERSPDRPRSPRSPRDDNRFRRDDDRRGGRSGGNMSRGRYRGGRRSFEGDWSLNGRDSKPLDPNDPKEKDPRSLKSYVDLDRPGATDGEVDFEKALAAFAAGVQ